MSNYPYLKQYEGIYTGEQKLTLVQGRGPDEGEMYGDGTEFLKKVLTFVDYTINSRANVIWYSSDTEKFKTNQANFPFVWYNK